MLRSLVGSEMCIRVRSLDPLRISGQIAIQGGICAILKDKVSSACAPELHLMNYEYDYYVSLAGTSRIMSFPLQSAP